MSCRTTYIAWLKTCSSIYQTPQTMCQRLSTSLLVNMVKRIETDLLPSKTYISLLHRPSVRFKIYLVNLWITTPFLLTKHLWIIAVNNLSLMKIIDKNEWNDVLCWTSVQRSSSHSLCRSEGNIYELSVLILPKVCVFNNHLYIHVHVKSQESVMKNERVVICAIK